MADGWAWVPTTEVKGIFTSRIEKRMTYFMFCVIALPLTLISQIAVEQIRDENIDQTTHRISQAAKDYGMVIVERIDRAFENELTRLDNSSHQFKPHLTLSDAGKLTLTIADSTFFADLPSLIEDQNDIANATRCVSWNSVARCSTPDPDAQITRTWTVRLISRFDTDAEIFIQVSQSRQSIADQLSLMTQLLPYWVALIACMTIYFAILFLRRRLGAIPVLTEAVKQIEKGAFDEPVAIHTNDEFELLGNALNSLSSKLGDAFGYRQAMSNIDELILVGAPITDICETICQASIAFTKATCTRIISTDQHGAEVASAYRSPADPDPDHAQTFAASVERLAILSEEKLWGWLTVDTGLSDEPRIKDLAQKASVAVTNATRSQVLLNQATFDSLTGLLNRSAFNNELKRAIQYGTRYPTSCALVYLDLDDFKNINDTEGHSIGDILLCKIANQLSRVVRETDVVARLGGDEFAIILRDLDNESALTNALQRIIHAVTQPVSVSGTMQTRMSCSLGVCRLPGDGHTIEELIRNADLAMYRAKATPGPAWSFFDPQLNEHANRRAHVERRLSQALRTNGITVELQPKLHIDSGSLNTMEALARWRDVELGQVSPEEFIPIAERCGLINDLTEMVIAQVAMEARKPQNAAWRIAINISPLQFAQTNFVAWFLETLKKHQMPTSQIEVEITESLLMEDADMAQISLEHLRREGVHIALDDFGTGYSSLSLLSQLSIDSLKLDKSFIDAIPGEGKSLMLVQKIVEIARLFDMEIIAEGVETHEQYAALRRIGCTHIQGYLICKPTHLNDVEEVIHEYHANTDARVG